jgi:hypothetical protein
MRSYYRKFVFTALLVIMLVPGVAGTAGADLVRISVDNTDNVDNTGTVNNAGQTKSARTVEKAATSVSTPKSTNTSDEHDSRTSAKKKGGWVDLVMKPLSNMAYVLPASLQGKLAPLGGPEMAAFGASYVSPEQAVKIAQHMDPEFLVECIHYFEPDDAAALMEAVPNDLLLDIADRLIKNEEYALMASFSDHMSLKRLDSLFTQFNDADVILKVSYHMKNIQLLANIVAALPQEYASQLIYDVVRLGATDPYAFELMANLSQRLPVDRILQMTETVAPSDVAIVVIHYPPELIVKLMDRFDDYQRTLVIKKMSSHMTPAEIGSLFRLAKPGNKVVHQFAEIVFNEMTADQIIQLMDATGPAYLAELSLHCPPEMATKVLTKMDGGQTKEFVAKVGERITPVQIAMLMEMAHPEYVAAVLPFCSPEVIDAVLSKANQDHLARMALHFPPELGIRTLKKLDKAQTRILAAHIGRSWTAKQISISGADATYVAMILFDSPPEVVSAVKDKLDNAQLQGLIQIAAKKVESGDPRAMKLFSQLVVR